MYSIDLVAFRSGSVVAEVEMKFGKSVTDPLKPLEDDIKDGKLGAFTVNCKLDLNITTPPPASLFSTATPPPVSLFSTTSEEPDQPSSNAPNSGLTPSELWGIIGGCIAFVLVVLIIIVVSSIYCRKNKGGGASKGGRKKYSEVGGYLGNLRHHRREDRIEIQVNIQDVELDLLIDLGAKVSIINEWLFMEHFSSQKLDSLKSASDTTVKPVTQKRWRLPLTLCEEVSKELRDLEEIDAIEELLITVDQKSGRTYDRVLLSTIFSKLNRRKSYLQILLHEDSKHLTAFITHDGVLQYKRMSYGLSSAPSAFQKILSSILSGVKGAFSIIHDLIVHGKDFEQHDERLNEILSLLNEHHLSRNTENAPESDRKDLLSELELMKKLKPHPHVIKLMGCITNSDPLLVLIEHIPYGDLLGYLRKSRGLNDTYFKDPDVKPETNLTSEQLVRFAWQIADGMKYLSSKKIIHRDLAARNVLVGEGEGCKVTDFGMARNVGQDDIYTRRSGGRLPVKWTAYEGLLYGTYTTQSDV
ncbi:Proto-oncogene tyrosine-protein kinase receptor Ret [Stylophora pistillata]|uniref:Proto-oncogene tyrosine-protein kinase receptor Ret n=1 Tax=Stylophora pistillata TaxID=50429 RepID=A0A2B4RFC2_STYPI|nr:Proto-oncogene tyrosine-protein kinase receptor Ret [Stylophora pistillata]